tara:strand:+ start:603 stop:1004 length:402 start_codon:yes stop_codon:yes gene_type:complete
MPSIRKRIGYLPSLNIQKIITSIAQKEQLSQSKVVGILVEEALLARGLFDLKKTNDLIKMRSYREATKINNTSLYYSDLDELISDKGITYNTKKGSHKSDNSKPEKKEFYNEDLFELFKQFLLFQKMIEEEKQ